MHSSVVSRFRFPHVLAKFLSNIIKNQRLASSSLNSFSENSSWSTGQISEWLLYPLHKVLCMVYSYLRFQWLWFHRCPKLLTSNSNRQKNMSVTANSLYLIVSSRLSSSVSLTSKCCNIFFREAVKTIRHSNKIFSFNVGGQCGLVARI